MAIDLSGNAYLTGSTQDTNFPATRGAYKTAAPTKGTAGSISAFFRESESDRHGPTPPYFACCSGYVEPIGDRPFRGNDELESDSIRAEAHNPRENPDAIVGILHITFGTLQIHSDSRSVVPSIARSEIEPRGADVADEEGLGCFACPIEGCEAWKWAPGVAAAVVIPATADPIRVVR